MEILVLQDSTQALPPPGSLSWCLAGLNPNSATTQTSVRIAPWIRARLWKLDISAWNPGSATYLLCDLVQMINLSVFVFAMSKWLGLGLGVHIGTYTTGLM